MELAQNGTQEGGLEARLRGRLVERDTCEGLADPLWVEDARRLLRSTASSGKPAATALLVFHDEGPNAPEFGGGTNESGGVGAKDALMGPQNSYNRCLR